MKLVYLHSYTPRFDDCFLLLWQNTNFFPYRVSSLPWYERWKVLQCPLPFSRLFLVKKQGNDVPRLFQPLKGGGGRPPKDYRTGFFQAIIVNFLTIGIHGTDIMHPYMNTIIEYMNHQIKINCSLMCVFFFRTVRPKMGINIKGDVAKFEKNFFEGIQPWSSWGRGKIHSFKEVPLSLVEEWPQQQGRKRQCCLQCHERSLPRRSIEQWCWCFPGWKKSPSVKQ